MGGKDQSARKAEIRQLVSCLEDPDARRRCQAVWQLHALEAKAAEVPLRACVSDSHMMVRLTALKTLGRIGGPESCPVVARALGDPVPEVRSAAAMALGRLAGADEAGLLRPLLHDETPVVRAAAFWAVTELGAHAFRDALAEALADEDVSVRFEAARGLASIGDTRGPEALQAILDGKESPDWIEPEFFLKHVRRALRKAR